MKKWMITLTVLVAVFSATAELISDPTFSGGVTDLNGTANANYISVSNVVNDALGWAVKGSWSGTADGQSSVNNGTRILATANSVGSATGNSLAFSFDWTPAALAAGDTLTVYYQVVGWYGADNLQNLWNVNNANSSTNSNTSVAGALDVADLLSGNTDLTAGADTWEIGVTGAAGSLTSYSTTLDISGYDELYNDVSDLEYIGVAFYISSASPVAGSVIDNVHLNVVPEPATVGMLGLGALLTLYIRRMKRG